MTETTDWNQWRGSWQTRGPTSEELTSAVARFRRAKRRAAGLRILEWTIVVLAVAFPVAAMRHAANVMEAALGIGAIAIVAGVAGFRAWNQRAERHALGTSAREFEEAARALHQAELRFVRFLWLVLSVESFFAAVWWYGGMEVHHDALAVLAIVMLWVPLLIVVATLTWSIRLWTEARRELATLAAHDREPEPIDG